MHSAISVLIVDDDDLARTGLRTLLNPVPDVIVIGEANDGTQVVEAAERLCPDVILMDVRMPGMDGISAVRRLRAELEHPPRVVVITTFENDEYVYDSLRAGAHGFVLKRARVCQIAHAIRVAFEDEFLLFPTSIRSLAADHSAPRPGNSHGPVALTDREAEVLRRMCDGLSNSDIAEQLAVRLETVKSHVSSILTKLGARNRTQAVIAAYESGFVTPRPSRLRTQKTSLVPNNGTREVFTLKPFPDQSKPLVRLD